MIHLLQNPFVIDVAANPRFADASLTEIRRSEQKNCYHGYYRAIGGYMGDLLFNGYTVEDGRTTLIDPAINWFYTEEQNPTPDELDDLARRIFDESFASIGMEGVEHS